MKTLYQKWSEADRLYEESVRSIEANMSTLDIGCSHYQLMRVDANKRAGLPGHTPHCRYNDCIAYCPKKDENKA